MLRLLRLLLMLNLLKLVKLLVIVVMEWNVLIVSAQNKKVPGPPPGPPTGNPNGNPPASSELIPITKIKQINSLLLMTENLQYLHHCGIGDV